MRDGVHTDLMPGAASGLQPPLARVVSLSPRRRQGRDLGTSRAPGIITLLVSVVVAVSPLMSGYFDFTSWGVLAIGAVAVLVILALISYPGVTVYGISASGALIVLLLLSFASMLWAESRDAAWTESNRLALYAVVFGIALLGIRERRSARSIILVLGAPALLTSVLIALEMATGGGRGAFLEGRLDSPIGYINGTAGLLVMGIWPWFSLAERASRRAVRSLAFSGAALIAATAVLTQSRAVVPALIVTTVLVLLVAQQRVRRAVHLLLLVLAVAGSVHWTLAVYRSTGPTQALPIPTHDLKVAGLAVLLSGFIGLACHAIVDTAAAAIPGSARRQVRRAIGAVLLIATLSATLAVGLVGHSKIAQQWHDFTALKVNQAAPNRFLDAGGFRYDLWRVAADEFRAHPLVGVGAGNYDSDYYRLRNNPQSVIQPHSLELQVAAELGVFGLLALLVFCATVIGAAFRPTRTLAASDPMVRIAAVGIFSSWLTATSVDWLYDIPGLTAMALMAAAALVVPPPLALTKHGGERASGATQAGPARRGRLAVLLALVALAVIAASVGRQYAAARYALSGALQVQRHPVAAIHTLEAAESLDPYSLSTLYSIASAYARLDNYAGARAALLAAARREPLNYVPPALLGDLATRYGEARAAGIEYSRALRLNPQEPALKAALEATSITRRR